MTLLSVTAYHSFSGEVELGQPPLTSPAKIFGWLKTIGGVRQTKFRGLDRVGMAFTFALAAYNLVRLPKLVGKTA
jgi:hypothetical protein